MSLYTAQWVLAVLTFHFQADTVKKSRCTVHLKKLGFEAKISINSGVKSHSAVLGVVNLNQRNPIFTALCWSSDWEIKTLDCNDGLITITQFSHWFLWEKWTSHLDWIIIALCLGRWLLIDNGFKTNCREDYQGGLFAAANPNIKYENYQKSGPPIMSIVRILMVKSG